MKWKNVIGFRRGAFKFKLDLEEKAKQSYKWK